MNLKPSDFGGLFSARRIVVTGANGAGKTVFAQSLANARGVPLYHNDALVLLDGWRRRADACVQDQRREIAAKEAWILEGGPSILAPGHVITRADLVIWLDMSRVVRCWRILRRTVLHYDQTRLELPDGNPERFDRRHWQFLRKAWQSDAKMRSAILRALENYTGQIIHLASRAQVTACLQTLDANANADI